MQAGLGGRPGTAAAGILGGPGITVIVFPAPGGTDTVVRPGRGTAPGLRGVALAMIDLEMITTCRANLYTANAAASP